LVVYNNLLIGSWRGGRHVQTERIDWGMKDNGPVVPGERDSSRLARKENPDWLDDDQQTF
jgi:hypothetical protein